MFMKKQRISNNDLELLRLLCLAAEMLYFQFFTDYFIILLCPFQYRRRLGIQVAVE